MIATQVIDIVLAASAFLLVVSLWVLGALVWSLRASSRSRKIHQRIGLAPEEPTARELRLWRDGKEAATVVPGLAPRVPLPRRFAMLLRSAGWSMRPAVAVAGLLGGSLLAFLMMMAILHNPILSLTAPATLVTGAWIYLKHCVAKQEALFDRQFVDGLDLAARSLRAGHPLHGAFRLISEEVPAPVGTVFAEICQQQGVGVSLEHALRAAATGCNSLDLKLFATSVAIQLRSGGNLSEMIERLAAVIRSRMWLTNRIRVLAAQTQFSKRLLLLLPFIVFLTLNIINPTYMQPLYTSATGQLLLLGAATGLLAGAWVMNRMVVLKF